MAESPPACVRPAVHARRPDNRHGAAPDRADARKFGLNQHPAAGRAAAGASRDLRQAREQALAGAKIRAVERTVGIDHADQS